MKKKIPKELMAASAAPIILSILQNSDNYGYEIVQEIKSITEGRTPWKEASIYPVLRKLENQGMIKSYWRKTPDERHRRYYAIEEAEKDNRTYTKEERNQIGNTIRLIRHKPQA